MERHTECYVWKDKQSVWHDKAYREIGTVERQEENVSWEKQQGTKYHLGKQTRTVKINRFNNKIGCWKNRKERFTKWKRPRCV